MAYHGFRQAGVEDEAESLARLLAAGANGGPAMPGVAAPTAGAGSLDKLRERANEMLGGRVRF